MMMTSEAVTETTVDLVADLVAAVIAAEHRALVDHQTGACRDSEWSCTYCEAASVGGWN